MWLGSRVGALAAALWLAVAGAVGAFLYSERQETLIRAVRTGEALVLALEAHTARTYQTVEITLGGIADALRLAPGLPRNDPSFHNALTERLQALQPYARALFAVGADGRLVHDSSYPEAPAGLSLHDRSYFQAHLKNPALQSAIWPPMVSRRPGMGWFLAVTRRLSDDGRFGGVAVAALEPQYFAALFGRLGLDTADALGLYHRDGTLIARYPLDGGDIGRSFADSAVFAQHLPRSPTGSYVTSSGVFSFERVVSYRAVEGLPLVVVMAQGTQQILATWRETALVASLALAALALLLAALAAQFLRQQRMRERAHERLLQSEKLEALGRLTGSVSHDFANLLNVVSASLRVIQAAPQDARHTREALAAGERAVMRGTQLIETLRSFARRQPLHVQPSDLNAIIVSGTELLRQAAGQGMRLKTELGAGLARCLLDETELEVALVNLLVNAKDANARRVQIRTFDGGSFVCLAVADDGEGMAAETRRRVFEPYFSTKGERGSGLGLAQVYGFLHQIGGDVHIESQPGKGTTVRLRFPKALSPGPQAAAEAAAAAGAAHPRAGRG